MMNMINVSEIKPKPLTNVMLGPWWWSNVQRARLNSDDSNPAEVYNFFVKFVFEKERK